MQASELVPTRFVWPYGGRQVHVCGSFTNWLTPIPMAMESPGSSVFAVVCNLPPGYHQYKFIVDGKWKHEEGQAFVMDPLGNTNNWLFVKRPEAPTQAQPQQPAGTWAGRGRDDVSASRDSSGMDWATSDPSGAGASSALSPAGRGGLLAAGGAAAPPAATAPPASAAAEAETSRARVLEFLQRHTAYELLPESSKVVVLDTALPVRQAFHALFEQSASSAPLWDSRRRCFCGLISPGDFIALLCLLEQGGPSSLSEAELDSLTIEAWMQDAAAEGGGGGGGKGGGGAEGPGGARGAAPAPSLISLSPEDSLQAVAHALLRSGCAALPMLSSINAPAAGQAEAGPGGGEAGEAGGGGARPAASSQLLHLCTMSGVLACLMRHFRGVPNALPLLSQPLGALPIGTWADGGRRGAEGAAGGLPPRPLVTMHPSTPLKTALAMLLQAGVGALPIVDDAGVLLDIYARNDILSLARNNAYSQLPLDSITVSQALHYMKAGEAAGAPATSDPAAPAPAARRCYTCTRADTLRTAMETLALPGVTRLVCVQAGTKCIEGIVTLSDIASFMFL